jgi:squalene cyclase
MEQILLHLFGDYIIQTGWMAKWKVRKFLPAFVHVLTYTLPFVILTQSVWALLVIGVTHFFIDRYSLAKKFMTWRGQPPNGMYVYPEDGFKFSIYEGNMFLVYVVIDNTAHLIINYLTLRLV